MTGFKLARIYDAMCTDPRVLAANRRYDLGEVPDEVIDGLLTDLEDVEVRQINDDLKLSQELNGE